MHSTAQLTRNTAWNVVGQAVPVAAAIFSVPVLITRLGADRFGVLTLVWVIVGYSGLFDLGVGRALTALVAGALGSDRPSDIPPLVWTSLALMFGFGAAGGLLLAGASPWLVHLLAKVPVSLRQEMILSLWVLAAAIPVAICSSGLAGILTAAHRFDLINIVQAPLGAASYGGPAVIAMFFPNLVAISVFLLLSRLIAALFYAAMCWRAVPAVRGRPSFSVPLLSRVLSLGGWMTVTNIVSPLMANMDRFFIGALISASAVAYYATSQEVVNRTAFLPVAISTALFPSFAGAKSSDGHFNIELFGRALDYVFLLSFPLALLMAGLAHDGFSIWLGEEFARAATLTFQILAFGMFLNSLARVPFTFVQAICRPDLTAKAHLVELPVYIGMLVLLAKLFGIAGVALAWSGRVLADALILFILSFRLAPGLRPAIRRCGKLVLLTCPACGVLMLPTGALFRYSLLAATLTVFLITGWTGLLTASERRAILGLAGARRRPTITCPDIPDLRS